jgi:hypothetical protein
MKTKKGFELRDVCGEHVVVAHGVENIDFSQIISLNESATYLWNSVSGKEFTYEDLTKLLLDEYDVDEKTAEADAKTIADQWLKIGITEK